MPKNARIFRCETCDFTCSKESNFNAHFWHVPTRGYIWKYEYNVSYADIQAIHHSDSLPIHSQFTPNSLPIHSQFTPMLLSIHSQFTPMLLSIHSHVALNSLPCFRTKLRYYCLFFSLRCFSNIYSVTTVFYFNCIPIT